MSELESGRRVQAEANPRFLEALAFAVRAHGNVRQARKGTDFPYVAHPVRVAEILDRFGASEDLVVASLLHDVIEDTDVGRDEIDGTFGARIGTLVEAVSELDKSLPWRTRKQRAIEKLESAEPDVLTLVAADKLDNVRAIADTLRHEGASRRGPGSRRAAASSTGTTAPPRMPCWRAIPTTTSSGRSTTRRSTSSPIRAGRHRSSPAGPWARPTPPGRTWRTPSVTGDPGTPRSSSPTRGSGPPTSPPRSGRSSTPPTPTPTAGSSRGSSSVRSTSAREGEPAKPTSSCWSASCRGSVSSPSRERRRSPSERSSATGTTGSPTKRERLEDLCRRLGLDPASAGDLRYQLLHRTVSALIEAERYGAQEALMLVHSFDPRDASLGDYQRFGAALGVHGADANAVSTATRCGGVNLRLGWVRESSDRTAQ